MDNTLEFFTQITKGLAHLRGRMKNLARHLSAAFPNLTACERIDFAEYEQNFFPERAPKCVIEAFIDLRFDVGKSFCWWVDVERINDLLNVEASIRRDDGTGEDTLWERTYQAATLEDLFLHLSSALDEFERFANQKLRNVT